MRIVLKPSRSLAAVIMVLFALPSTALLFFPYGEWGFLVALGIGLVLGYEVAKVQALGTAKTSIVCIVPPEAPYQPWSVVYRAGFVQRVPTLSLKSIAGCLWFKTDGVACLISRDRVSAQSWSALHWMSSQKGEGRYLSPLLKDEENLP